MAVLVLAIAWSPRAAAASASGDELVRQARQHEAAHEDDLAASRYTEALGLDPAHEEAWLGLGALRLRMGEALESERVFDTALRRIPTLHKALWGRARARWAQGRHREAEHDVEAYAAYEDDPTALRELAGWYGADGRTPAQLATWRRLLTLAQDGQDVREARRMVRALMILVDRADPVSSPATADSIRRGVAAIARRGG